MQSHLTGFIINNMDSFLNIIKKLVPERLNPVTQTKAAMSLPPQQAQAYRQQVDKTIPKLPTQSMSNPYAMVASHMMNTAPNAVAGAARLPAARNLGQGARDVADVASLPLLLSSLSSLLKPQAQTVGQVQQVAQPAPQINHSDLAEKMAGWQPGVKANFDYALLTKNAQLIRQLLPQVPKTYLSTFAKEIGTALGSGA